LTGELQKAVKFFDLNNEDVQHILLQGIHMSFLAYKEKTILMKKFQKEFNRVSLSSDAVQ
jgi:adenosine deaminase